MVKTSWDKIPNEPDLREVIEATRFSRIVRSLAFAPDFLLSAVLGPVA